MSDLTLQLENDDLALDFRIAEDGHYRITDKITGEEWTAPDLGMVKTWDTTEDRFWYTLLVPSPDPEHWEDDHNIIEIDRASDTEATIRVRLGGQGSGSAMGGVRLGIHFDIHLALDGPQIEMSIPEESYREHLEERFRVYSLELLPLLGATAQGAPGYMLLPTRCGALYYFDRDHPRAYKGYGEKGIVPHKTPEGLRLRWGYDPDAPAEYGSLVFGEQGKWEDLNSMPLYGIFREKPDNPDKASGFVGMVLGGDYDTEMVARRGYGSDKRACISPRFCYRYFWNSKRDTQTRVLRLVFLRGKEAHYATAGNLYRDYLIHEKKVPSLRERKEKYPWIDYFANSLYYRIMFGMTHPIEGATEFDPATKKGYETRCKQSFDDVAGYVEYFQKAGFDKVSFIGTGANIGGHDWAHPTVFPFEPEYGGEAGMKRLLKAVNDAGYTFGLHNNYKDYYTHSPDWREDCVQCNQYGELRFHGAWMGGYSYQGLPHKMHEHFVKRDLPLLRDLGMKGFFYFDAIGAVMEETFPPNDAITRREYGEGMHAYINEANEIFGASGDEVCITDSLGVLVHSNIFYGGGEPVAAGQNGYSRNGLMDRFVPVQNMIFHGLCLYSGGAEIGGMAGGGSWDGTTQEKVHEDYERWKEAQEWGGDLHYEFFTDHRELAPGITRSEFSDGTVIYANRQDEDYRHDGVTVPAKGHVVQRG